MQAISKNVLNFSKVPGEMAFLPLAKFAGERFPAGKSGERSSALLAAGERFGFLNKNHNPAKTRLLNQQLEMNSALFDLASTDSKSVKNWVVFEHVALQHQKCRPAQRVLKHD
ncbi:MAG: hypothetical protein GYB31_18825 [Bacteroidetes bacterium]|nr:hypothetical protein [Bacteroidota bacterium]